MSLPWSQFYSLLPNIGKSLFFFSHQLKAKGFSEVEAQGVSSCTEALSPEPSVLKALITPWGMSVHSVQGRSLWDALGRHCMEPCFSTAQRREGFLTWLASICLQQAFPSRGYKVSLRITVSSDAGRQMLQEGCRNIGWPMGLKSKTHS